MQIDPCLPRNWHQGSSSPTFSIQSCESKTGRIFRQECRETKQSKWKVWSGGRRVQLHGLFDFVQPLHSLSPKRHKWYLLKKSWLYPLDKALFNESVLYNASFCKVCCSPKTLWEYSEKLCWNIPKSYVGISRVNWLIFQQGSWEFLNIYIVITRVKFLKTWQIYSQSFQREFCKA